MPSNPTNGFPARHAALIAAAAAAVVVVPEVDWLARQFELATPRGGLRVTALTRVGGAIAVLELTWQTGRIRPQAPAAG